MNCDSVRPQLADWVGGELNAREAEIVQQHVGGCDSCRAEADSLRQVLAELDALPVPKVEMDWRRLYQRADAHRQRQARRWRRVGVAAVAVAAMLLLFVGLRVQVRIEANQIVLSWGDTPTVEEKAVAPAPVVVIREVVKEQVPAGPSAEEVEVLQELIHAIAADVKRVDGNQEAGLTQLRTNLDRLRSWSDQRFAVAEQQWATLYVAQFGAAKKGDQP
jgi:anti-sigma factor RsiW